MIKAPSLRKHEICVEKQVIALVPARGGSKGFPGKNLKRLANRTLVEISLVAALEAKCIDRVFLSSDDGEILGIGNKLGVELILRPAEFASDTASANDVVRHFLSVLPKELLASDPYVAYLQPTSPLRTARHIDNALQQMAESGKRSVVSVTEVVKSPYKSFRIDSEGCLQSLFDESLSNARRQDLPQTYLANGAIYAFQVSEFEARNGFPSNGSLPFVMSAQDSADIDTEDDLRVIERMLEMING